MSVGAPAASPPPGATWRSIYAAAGVLDRLVDRQDETGCLRRRCQSVDLYDGRLPHAGDEVISDILAVNIHAVPDATLG